VLTVQTRTQKRNTKTGQRWRKTTNYHTYFRRYNQVHIQQSEHFIVIYGVWTLQSLNNTIDNGQHPLEKCRP